MCTGEPKTKYKRTSTRKVRTGCVTCKRRHVKCDETKPYCKKCQCHGYKCDGYSILPRKTRVKVKAEETDAAPQPFSRHTSVSISSYSSTSDSPRSLSPDAPQPPNEVHLLHHVRTFILEDLRMGVFPIEFWMKHALPFGHADDSVKYALCALGSAHKHFKTRGRGPLVCSSDSQIFDAGCFQNYNRAIHHINSAPGAQSIPKMKTLLVCCVVFTCIENLLGRYTEALRHLRGGYSLLTSLRELSDDIVNRPESEESIFFNSTEFALTRVTHDLAAYLGVDTIPEAYLYTIPPTDMHNSKMPFRSIDEAAKGFYGLNIECHARVTFGMQQRGKHPAPTTTEFGPLPSSKYTLNRTMFQTTTVEPLARNWIRRVDLFRAGLDEERLSESERRRVQIIALRRDLWFLFFDLASLGEVRRETCESIFQQVETLARWNNASDPVFCLDANILPTISLVCASTKDRDIRQKGVDLLRLMGIREGVWDSNTIADSLESALRQGDEDSKWQDESVWNMLEVAQILLHPQ